MTVYGHKQTLMAVLSYVRFRLDSVARLFDLKVVFFIGELG